MISFRQFLTELLDKPFPWKWAVKNSNSWTAHFDVHGTLYEVCFDEIPPDDIDDDFVWSLVFNPVGKKEGTFDMTNEGFALEILATVLVILKDFCTTNPEAEHIGFAAKESSRQRAYARIVKNISRYLPHWTGREIRDNTYGPGKNWIISAPNSAQKEEEAKPPHTKTLTSHEREQLAKRIDIFFEKYHLDRTKRPVLSSLNALAADLRGDSSLWMTKWGTPTSEKTVFMSDSGENLGTHLTREVLKDFYSIFRILYDAKGYSIYDLYSLRVLTSPSHHFTAFD